MNVVLAQLAEAIVGAQGMMDHGMLVRTQYVRPLLAAGLLVTDLFEECSTCFGSGLVAHDDFDGPGYMRPKCSSCVGRGFVAKPEWIEAATKAIYDLYWQREDSYDEAPPWGRFKDQAQAAIAAAPIEDRK